MRVSALILGSASLLAFAAPAMAQDAGEGPTPQAPTAVETEADSDGPSLSATTATRRQQLSSGEIVVTARRREESLQDVPIAITVVSDEQISQQNIVNGSDLATFVPSLTANSRFGTDNASFAIRGFTQELRTTASVGLYFSEVVAQRAGQTSVTGGDGAGPGAFFDLQNIQVLKGPQGTLFGRNTTGGAILLEPTKPTDEFEGYVEASLGNFDMYRLQAVVNAPISDRLRARFGVDHQKRDGFLKNVGLGSDDRLDNTDYISARASLVWDVNDNIENYTIARYTHSDSEPTVTQSFACDPGTFFGANFCPNSLGAVDDDFYNVFSDIDNAYSKLEEWQIINKTTFALSDDITLKNIFAYGERQQELNSQLFGVGWRVPAAIVFDPPTGNIVAPVPPMLQGIPLPFSIVGQNGNAPTSDQKNIIEELQLLGTSFDEKLQWQVGAYYETSQPNQPAGTASSNRLFCPNMGYDPDNLNCQDPLGLFNPQLAGSVNTSLAEVTLESKAVYAQGTYAITDQFNLTAGIRYTWDESRSISEQIAYFGFPNFAPGPNTQVACIPATLTFPDCTQRLEQKSDAPTWLLSLDYSPMDDLLLYGKYARGYRQGSVIPNGPLGFQEYEPEKVDSYEIGAKWSFDGALRGNLNVAAFYNELSNQQVQQGFAAINPNVPSNSGIVNVGKSTIKGLEVEAMVQPTDFLRLNAAYTYLDTEVKEIANLVDPSGNYFIQPIVTEGSELPLSPEHSLSAGVSVLLPVDEALGDIEIGATYIYTDKQLTNGGLFGFVPSYELVNANISWNGIAGSPFDASIFATNLFDEEYVTYIPGLYGSIGVEFRNLGAPRMFGARLRYNF